MWWPWGWAFCFLGLAARKKESQSLARLGVLRDRDLPALPPLYTRRHRVPENPPPHPLKNLARWGDGKHLWWNIMYTLFGLSVWKAKVFFQPVYADFAAYSGAWAKVFYADPFGWILKGTVLLSLLYPIALARRGKLVPLFHWLATLGFLTVLFVFHYLNVPVQPHYFQSLWWVPFVGFRGPGAYFTGEKPGCILRPRLPDGGSEWIFSPPFPGLLIGKRRHPWVRPQHRNRPHQANRDRSLQSNAGKGREGGHAGYFPSGDRQAAF